MQSHMTRMLSLTLVVVVVSVLNLVDVGAEYEPKKTYIVHMDSSLKPSVFSHHANWFHTSLNSVSASARMLYTYQNAAHGFAARITDAEAASLKNSPGVLLVIPETRYELHTTRTSDFLGLTGKLNRAHFSASAKVSDVVIGVLDTGVWPEIGSYRDAGLSPVPRSWKGKCESGKSFNASSCNRKLVGARAFWKGCEAATGYINETLESKSPRDDNGHGTHTSTTVAGSKVTGASFLGFAKGTARGVAPTARIASYKVCWLSGCFGSDIIAAFESAIRDGVGIISFSLGGGAADYHLDEIAMASFTATAHGIFVAASAGNNGPHARSVLNIAPWMTTVGAGTIDRDFPAYLRLGNRETYTGVAVYAGKPLAANKFFPLVTGLSAGLNNTFEALNCLPGSLDSKKTAGKIIICVQGGNTRPAAGLVVKDAGGIGVVLLGHDESNIQEIIAEAHLLPTVFLSVGDGIKISTKYLKLAGTKAKATIVQGATKYGVRPSPMLSSFSSRGPNPHTAEILKPDLIAPGSNILAGWTGAIGPSGLTRDKRRVNFNIASGTSMSCPHVSGVAALILGAHPTWSPAAIRSALMTTAYSNYRNGKALVDTASGKAATPFGFGAGHVYPAAALDPGLVYDAGVGDYVSFLCALNYTSDMMKSVTKRGFACKKSTKYSVGDLNYPSCMVILKAESSEEVGVAQNFSQTVTLRRTLTNVGVPGTYKVSVTGVDSAKIVVKPTALTFGKMYEKKSFTVTVIASAMPSETERFARMEWSDGKHFVRSPIALYWPTVVSTSA